MNIATENILQPPENLPIYRILTGLDDTNTNYTFYLAQKLILFRQSCLKKTFNSECYSIFFIIVLTKNN